MGIGFGAGSTKQKQAHGVPLALQVFSDEVENRTPERSAMQSWLDASRREPLLRDVIFMGLHIERRVSEVLKRSGPIGTDHESGLMLMGLSMASSLLDDDAMKRCQRVELASGWWQPRPGRVAWSLAVGAGKTLMAASLCRAVVDQLQGDPALTTAISRGLVYTARTHQLLEGMLATLTDKDMGVRRELIGVFHGTAGADLPSIKREELSQFPILLTTQAQIQSASARHDAGIEPDQLDLEELLVYGGKDRLCIWDEAFQSSLADSVKTVDLAGAVGLLDRVMPKKTVGGAWDLRQSSSPAARTEADVVSAEQATELIKLLDRIEKQADVTENSGRVSELRLPPLPDLSVQRLKNLSGWLETTSNYGAASAVDAIAEMATAGAVQVSLLQPANGGTKSGTIVRPKVVISDRLQRLIVLDAGHINSALAQMDPTVQLANGAQYAERELTPKLFNAVTITCSKGPSGRSMNGDTGHGDAGPRGRLIRYQVERVARTPTSDHSLVVTYKTRGRTDFISEIKAELDKKVPNWADPMEDGKPRVEIITWGQHVGSNDWRHCKHLFFIGVLRRTWSGDLDAQSFAAGREDSGAWQSVRPLDVEVNQAACEIMQAIGRGHARVTVNGQAGVMNVSLPWIEGPGKYQGLAPQPGSPLWVQLEQMMPGVNLVSDTPRRKLSGEDRARAALIAALDKLPAEEGSKILSKDLFVRAKDELPPLPEGFRVSDACFKEAALKLATETTERRSRGEACWHKMTPSSRTWTWSGMVTAA